MFPKSIILQPNDNCSIKRKIDSNLASLQNCTNITHAPTSVIYHIAKLGELGENSRYNPRKGV